MRAYEIAAVLAITIIAPMEAKAQNGQAPALPNYPAVQGKVYRIEKVAEGVYFAMGDGAGGFHPNTPIIVNDRDVMIVDDGTTPAAARALVEDLKLITPKPIRYVVNTHFHHDHTDGNSVFGPEVEIIGHEYVRTALLTAVPAYKNMTKSPKRGPMLIETLQRQIAAEKDAGRQAALKKDLAAAQKFWDQLNETKVIPPTVTYTSKLVFQKGQREIQLLFLGRGHTAGDTIVFLPKERIVCTGDLMENRVSFMGDGFINEWIPTLEALKKLDFTLVLPGHGRPFLGKSLITTFQSYLTDLRDQVAGFRKQGLSPDAAAARVNLTSYKKDFPDDIQGLGVAVNDVRRLYQQMDQGGN